MKLTKTDTEVYHRALVVGLSGAGKSTLAAELANKFELVWLDLENGRDVLTKLSEEALARIEYIPIPDSASFPIGAQTLMALFKAGHANICEAHGKDNCALCKKNSAPSVLVDFSAFGPGKILVIDGGTQLASSILAYCCKDKPVEYKPERDDWGALRKYSEFFASQFQAFPGNLLCTCQAVEAEMEDGKVKLVPSFGSKDMSSKIAKAFSDVIYCETRNKKHVAFSSSTASNVVLTKSRTDFMIENLETPSLIPLFSPPEGTAEVASTKPAVKVEVAEPAVENKPVVSAVSAISTATPGGKAVSNLSAFLAANAARKAAEATAKKES